MKLWLSKCSGFTSLTAQNATVQAKIAVLLMAVIPAMSLFYMGTVIGSNTSRLTLLAKLVIYILTMTVGVSGFLILRKYPNNIMKLRQYVTTIAWGTLPEKIALDETQSSDDLKYIEESFNMLICELRNKIARAGEQSRLEHSLRKTINRQQQMLIEAELQRTMLQTLEASCCQVGRPDADLQTRLEFLQKQATDQKMIKEIEACIAATKTMVDILQQLRQISELRTEPYSTDDGIHAPV